MGYNVFEVESAGPGGAAWFVRKQLGVEAFGINDPETTRQPAAGPDGMTMIAIGARRGSYEPRGPF